MEVLKLLEERIGGRWTGIVFHHDGEPSEHLATSPMRLCEAIKESYTQPIVLRQNLIACPGALRSLGWTKNADDKIARKIAETMGSELDIAKKLVTNTPHLKRGASVTVGSNNAPDVLVSYAQPEAAMRLIRTWQHVHGADLDIAASSVMAICGNVVVRAYVTDEICFSFGCPDSRNYGAISRDRLVVGLPTHLVADLFGEGNGAPGH
jgi:uncharacterized protein (DUF169 family)